MMKRVGYTLLFLLFASCYVHAAGTDTFVGTYYYPWYDDSSFHGGSPTGSTTLGYHLEPTQVQPALGWYDQDNASVISQHYDWARYAGIDFFVCSYWGMGSGEDNIIRNRMFNNPDRGDIQLCVFMEPRLTPAHSTDPATEAEMTAEMNYLCDNYFDHPSYLYIDGKPAVFIYITRAMDNTELELCLNTFRTAALNKGYELYIAGDEVWKAPNASIDGPRVSQMDAITNYDVYGNNSSTPFVTDSVLNTWQSRNAAWKSLADTYGTDMIPAISPGYNDRTVRLASNHPACSRKLNDETHEFGTLFSGMIDRLEPDVEMIMINSWNEWHEDTQIEPTTVVAPTNVDDSATGDTYTQGLYYEGYGTRYLDILYENFNLIPIGATALGEHPPNETADKAFDGDVNTKWLDFSMIANGSSWIQWRYAEGRTAYATEYAITSANDAPERDPMDWNLLGSNDEGDTWDTLDSRTGEIFASRFERQNFSISSPGAYNIYRLEITGIADPCTATSVQLAEFGLCAGLADFNCNGIVSVDDLSYMADVWLTDDSKADIAEPADGIVNLQDFSILSQDWLNDPLTDGIVAYWKLNETAGAVAEDDSPNGYDGTLMNMDDSDWVEGVYGNALDFDGLDDYVKISGYKGVTGTASRTCAAWIKTDSGDEILSWGGDGTGEKWTFRVQSGGLIRLEVSGGAIGGSTIVNDGFWHHVAAVFLNDGTPDVSDVKLYVDGIEESTTSAGQAINTAGVYDVKIGIFGSSGRYFNGLIDDVRIYDRALSQDEIENIAGL